MAPPPVDPLNGGGERWIVPLIIASWVVGGAIAYFLIWATHHGR